MSQPLVFLHLSDIHFSRRSSTTCDPDLDLRRELVEDAIRMKEKVKACSGILVSGDVKVIKPDPRIFELLIERFAIDPRSAIFIDDVEVNAAAARAFGIHAIHFTTPAVLRAELVAIGLL